MDERQIGLMSDLVMDLERIVKGKAPMLADPTCMSDAYARDEYERTLKFLRRKVDAIGPLNGSAPVGVLSEAEIRDIDISHVKGEIEYALNKVESVKDSASTARSYAEDMPNDDSIREIVYEAVRNAVDSAVEGLVDELADKIYGDLPSMDDAYTAAAYAEEAENGCDTLEEYIRDIETAVEGLVND